MSRGQVGYTSASTVRDRQDVTADGVLDGWQYLYDSQTYHEAAHPLVTSSKDVSVGHHTSLPGQ